MIVVDASVFIDLIFDYSSERTAISDCLFKLIEEKKIPIFQPDAFKIELIGQLVRRLKKDEAATLAEEIFGGMNFIESSDLFDTAFSIAFQTGSRAIDSFYIAAANLEEACSSQTINVRSKVLGSLGSTYFTCWTNSKRSKSGWRGRRNPSF